MTVAIVLISLYLIGYFLAYLMMYTELKSEGEIVTIGGRALLIVLSLLSWFMIVYSLIRAWVIQINKTGYWAKPLKVTENTEVK